MGLRAAGGTEVGWLKLRRGGVETILSAMNKALRDQVLQLSPSERLELIGDLWDSLEAQDLPPLTKDQIEEFERRLAEHRADPGSACSWEEIRAELRSRFG